VAANPESTEDNSELANEGVLARHTGNANPPHAVRVPSVALSWSFLVCVLFCESAVEGWYRWHERGLGTAVTWEVALPRDSAGFKEVPFSETARQFLRYDQGVNAMWEAKDGTRWQGIFLRWNPGRIAVHLAKLHTPEVCLSAAGQKMLSQSDQRCVTLQGLELPYITYAFSGSEGLTHVLYCIWDDRAEDRSFRTMLMTWGDRIGPVLAGRRNLGQRSFEIAVWGIEEEAEAEAALIWQLGAVVKVMGAG
jgi:hypothetical protein